MPCKNVAGLLHEGIQQLDLLIRALKLEPDADQWERVLGLGLTHQALLILRKGEFILAEERYKEAIHLLRPVGDKALLSDALTFLGIILHHSGRYERARVTFREGLVLAQESHSRCIEAYAIFGLGYVDSLLGHPAEGYQQMMAALAIWRELGDPFTISLGLNFLVFTLIRLNRNEEAKASMLESIALCEQVNNRWGMGNAYRNLGLASMAAGELAQAQACFRKSLEIFGDYTIGWDIARSTTYLADAARLSGDYDEARD
jgi:tetratricopeptide (TPR) repeat protein